MKAKVYFTRTITPDKVVEAYEKLGIQLPGKVAVKVHSGEKGNQNYLTSEFWRPMVEKVNGTIVECNTAYGDAREYELKLEVSFRLSAPDGAQYLPDTVIAAVREISYNEEDYLITPDGKRRLGHLYKPMTAEEVEAMKQ